jgi:hypothetical protein
MAFPQSKTPGRRSGDLDRPWEPGDSIPVPEATHSDGDSAWALFNELSHQQEPRFADTQPMTHPPGLSTEEAAWAPTMPQAEVALRSQAAPEQPIFTLEAAMLVARRNNRVCPRPERWTAFMALLPPRKTLRGTMQPPVPPLGAPWSVTPPLTKRLCFREQIEWAQRAGVLEDVMAFMQGLPESDWLHIGED